MAVLQDPDEGSLSQEQDSVDEKDVKGNEAWASVMQTVLRTKPLKNKSIVLSKAKKLSQLAKETGEDKALGDGNSSVSGNHLQKKDWALKGRKKPNVLEKDREKALEKLAVKGVIQLFNAVSSHQKNVQDKLKSAGPSEGKQEKVLKSLDKNSFFSLLENKSQPYIHKPASESHSKTEIKSEESWEVLKDDFMIGGRLKDWDKSEGQE